MFPRNVAVDRFDVGLTLSEEEFDNRNALRIIDAEAVGDLVKEPVAIDDTFVQGVEYYIVFSYQSKDDDKMRKYGLKDYKSKWNDKDRGFEIATISRDSENFRVTVKGIPTRDISGSILLPAMRNFWAKHIHLEGVGIYEQYRMVDESTVTPEIPEAPQTTEPPMQMGGFMEDLIPMLIIGGVVIGGGALLISLLKPKRKKRYPRYPRPPVYPYDRITRSRFWRKRPY